MHDDVEVKVDAIDYIYLSLRETSNTRCTVPSAISLILFHSLSLSLLCFSQTRRKTPRWIPVVFSLFLYFITYSRYVAVSGVRNGEIDRLDARDRKLSTFPPNAVHGRKWLATHKTSYHHLHREYDNHNATPC